MPTIADSYRTRPVGEFSDTSKRSRALRVHVRAALQRRELARELAEGIDASVNELLALRAAQLTGERRRKAFAQTLRRSIAEAHRPRPTAVPMTKSVRHAGQSSRHLYAGSATIGRMARRPQTMTGRTLRLRVRIRRGVLDREIAAGLSPDDDPARATRAQQLLTLRERRCVAGCLGNILQAADERHADPASPLQLNHAEVLATRHDILALIAVLRSDRVIAARGVALARLLAEADDSPLLWVRPEQSVQQAVSEAIAAL